VFVERCVDEGDPMLVLLTTAALAAPPVAPEDARGSLAIYCASTCGEITVQGIPARGRLPTLGGAPSVSVERWGLEFGLPDAEHLQTWGSGDVAGVLEAEDVVVVSWSGPAEGAAERVAQVGRAALAAGQWFEDLDSGMVYDAESFAAALSGYEQASPDITGLTLLEGTQSTAGTRLVMHGLGKVGLPDLVMDDIVSGEENGMAIALSATAQTLFEQGLSRQLTVRADRLAAASVAATACGIQGQAQLDRARPAPDDTTEALASVVFTGGFSQCGAEQVAAPAPQPATLQEARDAAMAQLIGPVHDAFSAGLPEGGVLMVKAPFRGPGRSVEWLWLRVDGWRTDGTLVGSLLSEPTRIVDLHRGDEVLVPVSEVFDYVLVHPDGHREGNTTGRFLP
jgi:hypothetical protein